MRGVSLVVMMPVLAAGCGSKAPLDGQGGSEAGGGGGGGGAVTAAGGVQTGTGGTAATSGTGAGGTNSPGGTAVAGTDSAWAGWPMPNGPVDVAAGAPNPASYTDNGDGTVTDKVTGLMWQQAVPETSYTWPQAVSYCDALTLAGHSDWRLPRRIELVSLVDFGRGNPAIETTYFSSTPSAYFWTSSMTAGSSSTAWVVGFGDGYASGYTSFSNVSYPEAIRCVR